MELRLLKSGFNFNILAVVLNNGTCPAAEFLEQVKQNDLASHRSLVNILIWHADHGPIMNKRKSKVIKDRKNLLEFKTRQGDRIVYFYLRDRRTVLTHGFHKGAVASAEYDRAETIRNQYCMEVENGKS
jgi:hypothetical protein